MIKNKINYHEIKLNKEDPKPLYLQLADELRRLLSLICLSSNERMLSERRLSELLSIDRVTVGKAYKLIFNEGLLERAGVRSFRISIQSRRKLTEPYPTLGVILPLPFSEFMEKNDGMPYHFIKGIIDSAAERNISTIMLHLPERGASAKEIAAFNEELMKHVLGVIHLGGRGFSPDRPLEAVMKNEKVPQTIISAYSNIPNMGSVVSDPLPGGRALAEQLRAMRHKQVGIMLFTPSFDYTGTDDYFMYEAWIRAKQMREIFLDYGLECDDRFHCFDCKTPFDLRKKLENKLKSGNLPSVYWCANDTLGEWTIEALEKLCLRVPDDISVVGFDGADVSARDARLTTVCLPFYAIGRRAVLDILSYYENGISDVNRLSKVQTFFIMRKSLGNADRRAVSFMEKAELSKIENSGERWRWI